MALDLEIKIKKANKKSESPPRSYLSTARGTAHGAGKIF